MAAKTPIIIVSRTIISAKYVLTLCPARPGATAPSASFQEARITSGISTADMAMSTSAMPSTPSA